MTEEVSHILYEDKRRHTTVTGPLRWTVCPAGRVKLTPMGGLPSMRGMILKVPEVRLEAMKTLTCGKRPGDRDVLR